MFFFLSLQFEISLRIFVIYLQKRDDSSYHYQCLACATRIIPFTCTRHCVTVPLCKYIRDAHELIVQRELYCSISRCIYIFNYTVYGSSGNRPENRGCRFEKTIMLNCVE